jgi:hypothetical protein
MMVVSTSSPGILTHSIYPIISASTCLYVLHVTFSAMAQITPNSILFDVLPWCFPIVLILLRAARRHFGLWLSLKLFMHVGDLRPNNRVRSHNAAAHVDAKPA